MCFAPPPEFRRALEEVREIGGNFRLDQNEALSISS
jgi:hypothetical protein